MQRGSSDGGGPCDEEVGDFDAAIYTLDSVCSAVSFSLSLGRARSAFAAADLFSFDSVTSTSSSGLGGACWSGEVRTARVLWVCARMPGPPNDINPA